MLKKPKFIEEVETSAPKEKVWKAWSMMSNWPSKEDRIDLLKVKNKKFNVVDQKGVRTPFKFIDINDGKSFTILWYSFLMKMEFTYKVEPKNLKSLISCEVRLKGFFAIFLSSIIVKRVRKSLKESLAAFAKKVENS